MSNSQQKQIYFHVGTGKTGTTFLQYRAFPKFKGVHYIQRTSYRKAEEIINGTNYDKYFISWEMDQQLEHEVKLFAEKYPDTTPIIVFRRHDSYLASQYRRFVKNGFKGELNDFLDLENDKGLFKIDDFNYSRMIKILGENFSQKPIVFIYDDLRKDPEAFIGKFASIMGATIDLNQVDFSKKHASYNEKQLKAMKAMGKHFNMKKRRVFKNGALHFLWKLYFGAIRYSTLYIAKILPASFFDESPLMNEDELKEVRNYFADDWNAILDYAKAQEIPA